MELGESLKAELPVIDRSNVKDFLKRGVAISAIVLWSALTVENIGDNNQDNYSQQWPMPAPPAVIRDE